MMVCTQLHATPTPSFLGAKHSNWRRCSKGYLKAPLQCIQHQNYKALIVQGTRSTPPYNKNLETIHSTIMQLEIPAITCLFQEKCHPEYESVRAECDSWTLSLFDPPPLAHDPHHVSYVKGLYPLFSCLIYPSTPSRRRLVLLTKLMNWLFILDDMLEKTDWQTTKQLIHGFECILKASLKKGFVNEKEKRACCQPSPSQSMYGDTSSMLINSELAKAFLNRLKYEVWEDMCSDMTHSFCVRMVVELLNSLKGMGQHKHFRHKKMLTLEEGANPTLDDAIEMRLHDSFAKPCIGACMEYALEIDLEDIFKESLTSAVNLHEKMEGLKRAAACQLTWTNDLLSLRKELFKGECLSIVGVLVKENGINVDTMDENGAKKVQETVNQVWGMIKEQEIIAAKFLEEIKEGHGLDLTAHKELVMYCEDICKAMAGNMYWSTVTARYNGLDPLPWNTPTSISIPYHITSTTLDFLH